MALEYDSLQSDRSAEVIARSGGFNWTHVLLTAALALYLMYVRLSNSDGYAYVFAVAIAGWLAFDLLTRLTSQTTFLVDRTRERFIVRKRSLGRLVNTTEYDLAEVEEIGVEAKERWGERIVVRFRGGTLVPLEERFSEGVDRRTVTKANQKLNALRVAA